MTIERSLGEPATDKHVGQERDITLDEWIEGVRGFRLPVTLITVNDPDGSAAARLAEIEAIIDGLPDGPTVDALVDEAIELQGRVVSRHEFVLEQRSRERIEASRSAAMEASGVKADEDWSPDQLLDVTFRMLLDQIVSPEGVTVEQLRRVHAAAPDQADLLADAMRRVNGGAASSKALMRDFSKRSSRTHSTRAS